MKFALVLLPLCLASLVDEIKLPSTKDEGLCIDYTFLAAEIAVGLNLCDLSPIEELEGCELRELMAEAADYFQCAFSSTVGWVEEDADEIVWDQIEVDFDQVQEDGELIGAVGKCKRSIAEISEDEILTLELFDFDPSSAGEQEDCWYDGVKEIKMELIVPSTRSMKGAKTRHFLLVHPKIVRLIRVFKDGVESVPISSLVQVPSYWI